MRASYAIAGYISSYIARAGGVPHWEFSYGGVEEQVEIQLRAWKRHPQNDILRSWTGTNRGPVRRRFVREGGREFIVNLDTGERHDLAGSQHFCTSAVRQNTGPTLLDGIIVTIRAFPLCRSPAIPPW